MAIIALFALSAGTVYAVPGSPTNLGAQVTGNSVLLNWVAPLGAVVVGYRVRAGTEPGLSNVTDILIGPTTQLSAVSVLADQRKDRAAPASDARGGDL